MDVQTRLWLSLLLPLTALTGPVSTAEEKLDMSQELSPVQPQPAHHQHLSEHDPCAEELQPLPDTLEGFLLALRDDWGKQSELEEELLAQFGVCSQSDGEHRQLLSSLSMLAEKTHKENSRPGVLHIKKEHWDVEENGKFTLTLHFKPCKDHQQAKLASIILVFFVDTINTEELNIKFNSHALQPNKQTVCVSKGTKFITIAAGQAEIISHGHLKLRIVVDTHKDGGQKMDLAELKAILKKKDNKTDIALNPAVLFFTHETTSELQLPPTNRTFLFLCELQKFLNEVLPQTDSPQSQEETVSQSVLHSLPPLTLGSSTSESLLLELINSSGPTVFSFPRHSTSLQGHRGELLLTPALLTVLRLRLEQTVAQLRMEEAVLDLQDKLQTLTALTALPQDEAETGVENPREVQYRALLLLKALQTVLSVWAVDRAQRAARADQQDPSRPTPCRLQSLTVSLEKYLLEPRTANINNCEGACGFPLPSGKNHAILLNSHLQSGAALNRTLCCVPVDYDDLCVIELDSESTIVSYKTNMIAKECECR